MGVGLSKVEVFRCRMCCMMVVTGGSFVPSLGCGAVGWRLLVSLVMSVVLFKSGLIVVVVG